LASRVFLGSGGGGGTKGKSDIASTASGWLLIPTPG
jgi:hypothetical protein